MRDFARLQLFACRMTLICALATIACSDDTAPNTDPGAISLVLLTPGATVPQAGSTSATATATRSGNFTGAVSFSVTGLTAGITASPTNLQTIGPVTTATINFVTSSAANVGTHNLSVRAGGLGVDEVGAPFALTVTGSLIVCSAPTVACEQWASTAIASSQYTSGEWSAMQATGQPDVTGCSDDPKSWASYAANTVDWLELSFPQSVRPTEIRVHENFAVSSIVKVEVKDGQGVYHTVYTATAAALACPRVLAIPVTGISVGVQTVRVTVDQRTLLDWNEIDAVKLIGFPM